MDREWNDIVEGCRARERRAQYVLYERFFPYGMSVAVRYCDDRDQAVAILHDAFLTVFRRFERYDPGQSFKPWFRVIVVRAALDWLKANRKLAAPVELHPDTEAFDREDILSRIGYQELLAMIRRLSDGYRAVFNLHVIDGFKHEEIARQLGITVGTSKSNLAKARRHLQRMVRESLAPVNPSSTATS